MTPLMFNGIRGEKAGDLLFVLFSSIPGAVI